MKSDINPFDSQEAKPYKNDPEILAMTNLVVSYQNNDINEFESILRKNHNNIMADQFIKEHIEGAFLDYFIFNTSRHMSTEDIVHEFCFRFTSQYPHTSVGQIDSSIHPHCYSIHLYRTEH